MIDLRPEHLAIVRRILSQLVPEREAWAFGSRVTGAARKHSDLDLAIIGDKPLPLETLGRLRDAFDESSLPMRVDIVDWATASEEFRALIRAKHELVRERDARKD